MSNTTTSPWTGTNLWVNILLLLASIGGGMSQDTAGLIVAAVTGAIGAIFAVRNWLVNAKFTTGKKWIGDPNNWAYLSAVVVAIAPKAGDIITPLRSLFDALSAGNWGQVITAGFTVLSLIFYTFFKKPATA